MNIEVSADIPSLDCKRAEAMVAEALRSDCAHAYVPRDTGNLQDHAVLSGSSVTWTVDYAAYVYHGTSKMAGRPWAETCAAENMGDYCRIAAEELVA